MPPTPKLYRAMNEVTGEMLIDTAVVLADKLVCVPANISKMANERKMLHKEWRIQLIHEKEDSEIWFMSDTDRREWEEVCKPFREVSEKRRNRNAITNTGTKV